MYRASKLAGVTLAVVVGLVLPAMQVLAGETSLTQAVQNVEKETKMLVVKAGTAGTYHQIVAIGDGKTKIFKVDCRTGKLELSREKGWSDKSAKIAGGAKVSCSAAAANAVKECKGTLRSVKASLRDNGSVEFLVCVRTDAKGDFRAKVCACSGKVGAVEATEGAPTEGCE